MRAVTVTVTVTTLSRRPEVLTYGTVVIDTAEPGAVRIAGSVTVARLK
jgi:hypothetical protein